MRTAVVHDWLNGMRGGEKVLEEILPLVPDPTIFTLFHVPGSVSAAIERHPIRASFLNRLPFSRRHYRQYLPLFPRAVEFARYRVGRPAVARSQSRRRSRAAFLTRHSRVVARGT